MATQKTAGFMVTWWTMRAEKKISMHAGVEGLVEGRVSADVAIGEWMLMWIACMLS